MLAWAVTELVGHAARDVFPTVTRRTLKDSSQFVLEPLIGTFHASSPLPVGHFVRQFKAVGKPPQLHKTRLY